MSEHLDTMSNDEKLIYMANQIADFFSAQGEARAVAGIADHIEKFWTPKMRKSFIALTANDDSKLRPYVRKALERIAATVR